MTNQEHNEEINKYVHELMGLCWCDWLLFYDRDNRPTYRCVDCGVIESSTYVCPSSPDYANYLEHGKPFGDLLLWLSIRIWEQDFVDFTWIEKDGARVKGQYGFPLRYFVYPPDLAAKLKEYMESKNGYAKWKEPQK